MVDMDGVGLGFALRSSLHEISVTFILHTMSDEV